MNMNVEHFIWCRLHSAQPARSSIICQGGEAGRGVIIVIICVSANLLWLKMQ